MWWKRVHQSLKHEPLTWHWFPWLTFKSLGATGGGETGISHRDKGSGNEKQFRVISGLSLMKRSKNCFALLLTLSWVQKISCGEGENTKALNNAFQNIPRSFVFWLHNGTSGFYLPVSSQKNGQFILLLFQSSICRWKNYKQDNYSTTDLCLRNPLELRLKIDRNMLTSS